MKVMKWKREATHLYAHPKIDAGLSPHNRKKAGINASLVRLSVGVESEDHLIADIAQALDRIP